MKQERLRSYLEEMEQVASEIMEFLAGLTLESFRHDVVMQRAIGMNLLMIGEMANRLLESHPDFVADHPEIPWIEIRGMRNRIARGYFRMDLDTVWDTATRAVPDLLETLRQIRNPYPQGE